MKQKLVWVLLLALGLRVGAALAVQEYLDTVDRTFLIEGDAAGYWELAHRIADGEPYSIYSPPRHVMRMPGYPLFLAASLKVGGESLLPVRLLQACVGTLTCWLVHVLGSTLIDEQTGLLAAFLAAIAPTFVGFSPLVLSETLFAATIVGSLILMAHLSVWWPRHAPGSSESPEAPSHSVRTWLALITGFAVAVACYVRPSWLLTAPLFFMIHLFMAWWTTQSNNSSTVKRADEKPLRVAAIESALIIAGLGVALSPWTVRNWLVTGHPIPTTLWVGPSLYDGLHPEATGDSDMQFFERDNLLASMSEYEMNHEYRRRAWEFVRENPGRTFSLGVAKIVRFWKPWPNASQFRMWWLCLAVSAFFLPMAGLALYEATRRRHDIRCLLLTLGPVIYFTGIHAVFVGSLRYRLPAEYPLLILTAGGLLALRDRWQSRIANQSATVP